MTYRRDVQRDDTSVPLPVETVYNSGVDALREPHKYKYYTYPEELLFFKSTAPIKHEGHPNRIYFKPPEWKTSNVGEKIIGVREMLIHRRDCYSFANIILG